MREGPRRVNADSSTKATVAAEGRGEHGKGAKVKGTSGGFKFKVTVSVCATPSEHRHHGTPHAPTVSR